MHSIHINAMEFLGKKSKFIKIGGERDVMSYTFLITSVISHNSIYTISVASGEEVGIGNELTQLDADSELYIIKTMSEELNSNNKKEISCYRYN